MTTYTINNRPKLLAPGDEVVFNAKGVEVVYTLKGHGRYLGTRDFCLPHNHIFNLLSLDAVALASAAYGYAAGTDGWPEASSYGDFPALTRLVNALYDRIAPLERPCKDCPLKEAPKRALKPGDTVRALVTTPWYSWGDVGTVKRRSGGGWRVDLSGHGNLRVYRDGEWSVPSECLELVLAEEPKQPALLSAGTWVRIKGGRTGAFREIVQIISVDNSDPIAPYEVKDARGETFWKCFDWVEPVENWERFKVGDYVKGKGVNSGRPYGGKITKVGYTGWPDSHISIDGDALEDTSVEFAEPPEAEEDHSFQPGDLVRVVKGVRVPAGTKGIVLREAEDDGYVVKWFEASGPHNCWAHRNQIEHV